MSSITTQPPIADADDAIQQRQKRTALAVAMLGFAVVALDAQITSVVLPAIRQHLGGGLSGLQWVVTGYTLMFSALLLFGGSVADRVGSKNAYRAGMALFVLASLLCGMAPSLPVLIAARLIQGAGAALVTRPRCRWSARPLRRPGSRLGLLPCGQSAGRSRRRPARCLAVSWCRPTGGSFSSSTCRSGR